MVPSLSEHSNSVSGDLRSDVALPDLFILFLELCNDPKQRLDSDLFVHTLIMTTRTQYSE